MRLDKFTIGSDKQPVNGIDKHRFKNLKNVTIDFDEDEWITVVIGWNGTGKSNVLEALAALFRDLITGKDEWNKQGKPSFAYILKYRCHGKEIEIDADPVRSKDAYKIRYRHLNPEEKETKEKQTNSSDEASVDNELTESISYTQFNKISDEFLPRYVFGYYSGHSPRMESVFKPYLEKYDTALRNGNDPGLRRLFYAKPIHSQFVLLAFMLNQDEFIKEFLHEHLGIDQEEGIDSVLFVLNQPPWKSNSKDGDPRFWNARGVVKEFLVKLYDVALAPIRIKRNQQVTLWNKKKLEYLYLYVKDVESLRELVGSKTGGEFFRDLESTYVSELIDEVRIRVKLKKNDGTVIFRELSEGEQQLLTVLGLLKFTAEDESLFLLDEPDTHLNPKWCVDYISYLNSFVNSDDSKEKNSHIILTTHNPIAIADLNRKQVQILYREDESEIRKIFSVLPEQDPRGMGYGGIITSDMFGLGSSLDKSTTTDLLEMHNLSTKDELSNEEKIELSEIRERLAKLDFNFASSDRLEREYVRARFDLAKLDEFESPIITKENKDKALEVLVKSLLDSIQKGK
jgi:predicted ATPase